MENLDLRSFLYDGSHNRSGYYQSVKSPRVVQPRSDINHIRQWAGSGDVELLEKVVLEGNGERVLEEKIYEPRTHNFMKTVPNMVAKCKDLHDAVHKGSMLQLQELLQNEPLRRKYVLCKDPAGVGLLHKAVYYDFYDIASWLVDNFPETVHQKDSEGRLPLHYAAMSRSDALSLMLEKAGGNNCGSMARDAGGKTPGYYRSQAGRSRLVLPQRDDIMNVTPNSKGLVIKPSNIRIWCHDHDIAKLARIVWEGQGWRLLGEISNRGIVKKFLDAVPYLMNTIKDIHTAVIVGDFENLRKITDDPVPPIMLSSKDLNGLTALHKAAGLGKDDMVEYLVNRYRDCINQQDFFGRTPLFYAASHNGDDVTFQTLTNLGAKQEILDDRGKTAAYYITRYNEVDRTVLVVIPEAPRTPSSNYPPNWDWKILEVSKEEVRNRSRSRRRHKSSSENITSNSRNSENAMINEPKSNMKMSNTQDFIKSLPNLNDHKLNYGEMKPKEKAKDEVHFKIKADKRSKSKNITENLSVGEHLSNTVKDVDKQMEAPFVPLNELTKPEHFNQSTSNSKKGEIATDINQKEKTNLSPASHDNDKIMSMSPEKIIASPKSVLRSHENENDISPSKVDKTVDLPKHAETKEAKSPVYNLVKEPHIKPVAPQNYRNEQIPKDESEHIISDIPSMIENSETKTDSVIENAKTELEQKLNTAPGLAEEKIMDHETDTSSNEEKKITSDDLKNSKIEPTLIVEKVAGSIEDDSRIVTSSTPQRMRRTSGCAKTKEKADIGEKANVVEKDQNKNHLSEDDSDDEDVQVQGESDSNLSETDMNLSGTKVSSSKSSSAKIGASSGHGAKERLIKGLVKGGPDDNLVNAGNEEIDSIKHDEPVMTKLNYGQAEVHDAEVEDFLNSGNMEMLASLVLNGEGSRLVGRKSNNREMQAFIDNVPTYMKKINRVHVAAREGNIRDLQAALDRRKFAIARDPISPNGCTPLHVATVFGKTNIIKYLGARFPETLSAVDFEGRTALHYAAVIPDNGHFFNLLQHLGANTKDIDDQGKSAEDYRNSEQFTYKQLLDDFDVDEATGNVLLADRVPNDTVSSRRLLDDPDVLSTLEKCFRLLSSARSSQSKRSSASSISTLAPTVSLGRFLKRNVFDKIKHRITKLDHDLFDVIWPAVKKIPRNSNIIRIVEEDFAGSVAAPDYYVYSVYEEFMYPLIKDLHNINSHSELRDHPSSIFDRPNKSATMVEMDVDPKDTFALSGTIEFVRNLRDFELPINLNVGQLEEVENIVTKLIMSDDFVKLSCQTKVETDQHKGNYYTLNEVLDNCSQIKTELSDLDLLIPLCNKDDIDDPDQLHGSFWPYGRGVYVSEDKCVAIWINVHDHLRVMICTQQDALGEFGIAFSRIARIMNYLHEAISFKWCPVLGHLTSRPTFLGCSLRFNLIAGFQDLTKDKENMINLCLMRGLQYRETDQQNIVKLTNYQCLGLTETQCFKDFTTATANLLQLEYDMSMQNSTHLTTMLSNIFKRKRSSVVDMEDEQS